MFKVGDKGNQVSCVKPFQKMIEIRDKSLCCGCTACMAVCPHDAISMSPDALGFAYPVVDLSRCVGCGLCDSVCSFASREKTGTFPEKIAVSAARHKDPGVLSSSQSGGVFTALSDVVLAEEGVIYGAAIDENLEVSHIRAQSPQERDRMRGSKYVQSAMGDAFRAVRDDLRSGRKVMFTGTPCQTAALKSFLPSSLHDNLILVDFLCHGVPSPAVWNAYVASQKRKGEIVRADFRDKSIAGWKDHQESFTYSDGRVLSSETFKVLFYKNIMLRHSCGSCTYDLTDRDSDIVIADFWGISEVHPEMDGDAGTSMVYCRTDKGRRLLDAASVHMNTAEVIIDRDFLARKNPNAVRNTHVHPQREEFEKAFADKGFSYVARRWGDKGLRYKVWQLKCLLRRMGVKI